MSVIHKFDGSAPGWLYLSRRCTGPVFPATVTSWPRGRIPPARRGAPVGLWWTVVVVSGVKGRPGSASVVSVARCRVRPRTSAFERRRVASSRRRPAAVHVLPAEMLSLSGVSLLRFAAFPWCRTNCLYWTYCCFFSLRFCCTPIVSAGTTSSSTEGNNQTDLTEVLPPLDKHVTRQVGFLYTR